MLRCQTYHLYSVLYSDPSLTLFPENDHIHLSHKSNYFAKGMPALGNKRLVQLAHANRTVLLVEDVVDIYLDSVNFFYHCNKYSI